MNIVIFLFHEYLGHKKFHNSEDGSCSPKKIVRNNQLIELKYENLFEKTDENSEYILTSFSKFVLSLLRSPAMCSDSHISLGIIEDILLE